jgi:ElaB/YqjD/DUF883 family membrane-anchored ribosome-binding protein
MATALHTRHHGNGKLGSVQNEIAELRDTVRTGLHDTSEGGVRVLRAAGATAMELADGAKEKALRTRERVGNTIAERPFTSVAIAAGAGAALMGIAMMLRRR